jgi:hypothetical protein
MPALLSPIQDAATVDQRMSEFIRGGFDGFDQVPQAGYRATCSIEPGSTTPRTPPHSQWARLTVYGLGHFVLDMRERAGLCQRRTLYRCQPDALLATFSSVNQE